MSKPEQQPPTGRIDNPPKNYRLLIQRFDGLNLEANELTARTCRTSDMEWALRWAKRAAAEVWGANAVGAAMWIPPEDLACEGLPVDENPDEHLILVVVQVRAGINRPAHA